jgi:hypothetical protein
MIKNIKPGHVARLSWGFWLASLCLPTFVSYYERSEPVWGFGVLLTGWLALLGESPAWIANPLLVLSLLLRNKATPLFAFCSAFFALHTFTLSSFPNGNGGTAIFGYGWGVLFWFIAIGLGLVHAGMRSKELTIADGGKNGFPWLQTLGILWLATIVMAFGYFAVNDRQHSNRADSVLLKSALFKREAVCTREQPSPPALSTSPVTFLEIVNQSNLKPSELLSWGASTVRLRNQDYSYIGTERDRILQITPAKGDPEGWIDYRRNFDSKTQKNTHVLGIKIHNPGKSGFEYTWLPDGPTFCPKLDIKNTVISALGLTKSATEIRPPDLTVAKGVVIGQEAAPSDKWSQNYNCADGVGYSFETSRKLNLDTYPFFIGTTGYSVPYPSDKALCSGKSTFFYASVRSSDIFTLNIAKRDAKTLELQWLGRIQVQNAPPALQGGQTRVLSVVEKGGNIIVKTQHYNHDQAVIIEAPHPNTLPPPKWR